jgi:hypothetical protein
MASGGFHSGSREFGSREEQDRKPSIASTSSCSSSDDYVEQSVIEEIGGDFRDAHLTRHVSPAIGASAAPELGRVITARSTATNATSDPRFQMDFEEDESDNPKQWTMVYKSMVIFFVSFSTMVV